MAFNQKLDLVGGKFCVKLWHSLNTTETFLGRMTSMLSLACFKFHSTLLVFWSKLN